MAAAWDLRRAGHEVTIFEAADYVGGLASGFKEPHWEWSVEKFYHHWFASDKEMLKLIDELGLRDGVIFPRPYTVIYHEGKFYPFDSMFSNIPLYILRFYPLQLFRIGLVGLYLRLTNNWRSLEKDTADQWMLKYAGETIYNKMWKPLLVSKFSEKYYKVVNMAWLWARLKARTTRLGTFEGGFQRFADLFAERLRGMGVGIRLGQRAWISVRSDLPADPAQARAWWCSQMRGGTLRPGPGHHVPVPDGAPVSRAAGRVPQGPAGVEVHGRSGDGGGAQAPAFGRGLLLVQPSQGGRLPDAGTGGAHQLRAGG
jgi:hypothetical protein